MKRLIIVIALVVFPVSMLFAHPAKEISIRHEGSILLVQVWHMVMSSPTRDMKKHYIKTITVTLNGNKIAEKTYTSQNEETFKEPFKIDAKKGDKLVVTATCNLGGDKTAEKVLK